MSFQVCLNLIFEKSVNAEVLIKSVECRLYLRNETRLCCTKLSDLMPSVAKQGIIFSLYVSEAKKDALI